MINAQNTSIFVPSIKIFANAFHSCETFLHECFHVTFARFIFSHSKYYKYALPLFLIYSFHNDDMTTSKRHVTLFTLIFLLKIV